MDEMLPPPPNVQALPVADVTIPSSADKIEYVAYPIRNPEEDLNDFKVTVRASTLTKCRTKLTQISNPPFPWYELALGISSLATGAFLGALPVNLDKKTILPMLFNSIAPIIAASAFVAYFFLRRTALNDPARVACDLLTELPDPDRTR